MTSPPRSSFVTRVADRDSVHTRCVHYTTDHRCVVIAPVVAVFQGNQADLRDWLRYGGDINIKVSTHLCVVIAGQLLAWSLVRTCACAEWLVDHG